MSDEASVSGNVAASEGGGIDNWDTLTLNGSATVSGNTSGGCGGGIDAADGTTTLNGTASVSGNTADFGGGGICGSFATIVLNDSATVDHNSATFGGGIYSFTSNGGGVLLHDASSVTDNTARRGGGIDNRDGPLILNGTSTIRDNLATRAGGGIANEPNGLVTLAGSATVTQNRADVDDDGHGSGGGILNCGASTGAVDGGNVDANYLGSVGTVENNVQTCP